MDISFGLFILACLCMIPIPALVLRFRKRPIMSGGIWGFACLNAIFGSAAYIGLIFLVIISGSPIPEAYSPGLLLVAFVSYFVMKNAFVKRGLYTTEPPTYDFPDDPPKPTEETAPLPTSSPTKLEKAPATEPTPVTVPTRSESSVTLLEQLRDELEAEHQEKPLAPKNTHSPLVVGLGVLSTILVIAVCVLSYQLVSAHQKIEALAQSNQTLVVSLSRVDEANIFQAVIDFFNGADDYIDYIENKDSRIHMRLSRMKFGIPEDAPDSAVDTMAKARYLDEKQDLRNTILSAIGAKSIIIVASSQSDKYHTLSCDYVKQILNENRIYYATAKEAEDDGKTPCSICRPHRL